MAGGHLGPLGQHGRQALAGRPRFGGSGSGDGDTGVVGGGDAFPSAAHPRFAARRPRRERRMGIEEGGGTPRAAGLPLLTADEQSFHSRAEHHQRQGTGGDEKDRADRARHHLPQGVEVAGCFDAHCRCTEVDERKPRREAGNDGRGAEASAAIARVTGARLGNLPPSSPPPPRGFEGDL